MFWSGIKKVILEGHASAWPNTIDCIKKHPDAAKRVPPEKR